MTTGYPLLHTDTLPYPACSDDEDEDDLLLREERQVGRRGGRMRCC